MIKDCCFEHQKIEFDDMPSEWVSSIDDFRHFLQNSWNERSLFFDDDDFNKSKQQFINFDVYKGIKTKNYIGTIRYKNHELNIFPKVFYVNRNENLKDLKNELIKNLLIWIGYCDKSIFHYIYNKDEYSDTDNLKELLINIYVKYLNRELNRQLYFKYEEKTEDLFCVKGKINFNDYITNKFASGNKNIFQCTYSSFEFDNLLNRIIKCVCRRLESDPDSKNSRKELRTIIARLSDVSDVNCQPSDCDLIYLDSSHKNYSIILNMSKMFLLNNLTSNISGNDDSYCFLFPTELLFEGFVAGFIKEQFEQKGFNVKTQYNESYLAELFIDDVDYGPYANLREDIIMQKDDCTYVLDTKYKELEKFEEVRNDKSLLDISINDIRQMAIYAESTNAKRLCLLYPLRRNDDLENINIHLDIDLKGNGEKIFPCDIKKIPFIFSDNVNETKERIRRIISETVE